MAVISRNRRTGLAHELLDAIDSTAIKGRTIALRTDIGARPSTRHACAIVSPAA